MTIQFRLTSELADEMLRNDPLKDYFTWWDDIEQSDVDALRIAIESASCEEDVQRYLRENPGCLIQHLSGGHGRWVIPKKKLGAEYVTDFVIGHRDSFGFHWQAVELESPQHQLFTRKGDTSSQLNHAIGQVGDWRAWLKRNQNYASRPISEGGLGLTDIDQNLPGLVLIGRRGGAQNNDRRRQILEENGVTIHTYDFLIDTMQSKIDSLRFSREIQTRAQ